MQAGSLEALAADPEKLRAAVVFGSAAGEQGVPEGEQELCH